MRAEASNDPDARIGGARMTSMSERIRKRYAEDAEYRARRLAHNRAYHRKHRQRINARLRERWWSDAEYRERKRARLKEITRRTAYGLTTADYERMRSEQNGVCVICKRESRRKLGVDHCHATGNVRGLLCHKCNTALGFFDDDSDRMREAGAYVDRARGVPEPRAEPGCTSPPSSPAPRSK